MSQEQKWSWRQTSDQTWQRPLHDVPAVFLKKRGDRLIITTNGALIHGFPQRDQLRESILAAWIRLLYAYPVLRVVLGGNDDVLEYTSPSAEEIKREAGETLLLHTSWEGAEGAEPFDWIERAEYPSDPKGKAQLHVFDTGDGGVWIL